MALAAAQAVPLAAVALLLPWSIYRRIRRNIGPQRFSALRLRARAAVVLALLAWLLHAVLQRPDLGPALLALAGGSLAGVLAGLFALRHTGFDTRDGALHYTPHPWIGAAVSLLLVSRILWRAYELYPVLLSPQGLAGHHFGPLSPLTVATLGLVLCYYGSYHLGLVRHGLRQPGL